MQQTSRETSWGKVIFKQEIREKVPSSVKRIALLVTPEYEGIFRNGGIGSYYRTLSEKLAAADFYVVLLLAQSKERFGGGSTIAVVDQIFSLSECEEVLELPSTHSGILSQFREWEWVGYENYGALFFAQAIATQFKDAYIYIEFPEMLGLGYRTIQAKRAGILGKNCVVAVTLHSGQEWLQEAHGSYLQVNPQWFWQVSHYEQYCFEQADLAFFLSHFLQEKVERYGWQTNHAWHLPYCFPVLAQASPVTTMTEDLQHLVKEDKIPVVFFGRLEERKGLLYFLEALELLEDSVTEKVQVIFLGKNVSLQTSGLQGLDSQDYIKETLGQSYQYSIVTDLFSQEAIELIRQLNSPLVCLTSKQENFPHAALEMAQLPMSLVVADAGGFQETLNLVERSLGVHWFAPQDAYSLAQALLKAISLYPEKLEVPTREFLDDINQKLLRQRWEYMGLTFEETVMSFESHSDKTQPRQWILGMTSMEEQLFLEDYAQNEYSGKGEIVELGCWLGSSTISLARGLVVCHNQFCEQYERIEKEVYWKLKGKMQKRYIVRLKQEERQQLQELVSKGKAAAYKIKHANILLNIDINGQGWTDIEAAKAFGCHRNTVANLRQRLVEEGIERALERKKPKSPSRPRICDGEAQAKLIALRCGEPPKGQARWTLRLLADKLVELEIVPEISYETVRQELKKTS